MLVSEGKPSSEPHRLSQASAVLGIHDGPLMKIQGQSQYQPAAMSSRPGTQVDLHKVDSSKLPWSTARTQEMMLAQSRREYNNAIAAVNRGCYDKSRGDLRAAPRFAPSVGVVTDVVDAEDSRLKIPAAWPGAPTFRQNPG